MQTTVAKDGAGVMKRIVTAAVSAAILFTMTGCGKGAAAPAADSSVPVESTAVQESNPAAESDGAEAETEPVKGAALSRNAARMWLLAGGKLTAVVEEAADLPELPEDVVYLGTEQEPSAEKILSVQPDVIIADRTVDGYAGILKELSDLDCDILEVGADSFGEYDSSMKLLTDKTGNEEAYRIYSSDVAVRNEEIISRALEAAHKVKVTVTSSPDQSGEKAGDESPEQYYKGRTPTYMVIRVQEDNCCAVSNDDCICSMLNDFGMDNANKSGQKVIVWKSSGLTPEKTESESGSVSDLSAEAKTEAENESAISGPDGGSDISVTVTETPEESEKYDTFAGDVDTRDSEDAGRRSFENLLANNPDFIFIVYEGDEKGAGSCCSELVKSCEAWKNSFAVQSRRVYELPQNSFRYQPDEKWDMAYEYLYQAIYNL